MTDEETRQAATHAEWLAAGIQEAIDDPRPSVPHDEVMAWMDPADCDHAGHASTERDAMGANLLCRGIKCQSTLLQQSLEAILLADQRPPEAMRAAAWLNLSSGVRHLPCKCLILKEKLLPLQKATFNEIKHLQCFVSNSGELSPENGDKFGQI